jgi:NAD(P)-dependent dehydrogenase (short-subunit alcohol dehydrogenase family)
VKATFAVDLNGVVAVVTGASRGAGRAIALVLGEAGATVYVTGPSVRGRPSAPGRSGTLEEMAEVVAERGGLANSCALRSARAHETSDAAPS